MAARPREGAAVVLAAALAMLAACSASAPERVIVRQFFEASRLYDRTAMAALGAATFNPATDGIVREFTITHTTPTAASSETTTEEVSVTAHVRGADGLDSVKNLIFTLERRDNRWTIAGLRAVP